MCKVLNVSYILLKPCNTVDACKSLDTKAFPVCVHLHNIGFLIHLRGNFAWEKDILLASVSAGLLQDQRLLLFREKSSFLPGKAELYENRQIFSCFQELK